MPNYAYTAQTKDGITQRGTIVAASKTAAVAALSEKGWQPLVVKESTVKGLQKDLKLPFVGKKVKTNDLVIFTRQLATMVGAGVPLVRSLDTLKNQTESPALKIIMEKVVAKVQGGQPLSDALEEHPKVFSPVYVNMVRAGESGGILDTIMERLATQVEKDAEIKGKLKSAMIYPAVISIITFVAFVFLMTNIVPKLKGIFDQFNAQLPLLTRIVLGISNAMLKYGPLLAIGLVIIIVAFVRLIHTPKGKYILDKVLLKVPVFGVIILKVNMARFSRTFSSLTSAGVSVLDGLSVTAGALSNSVIKKGVAESVTRVQNGQPISQAIEEAHVFPAIITQMTAVGEETGEVDKVLEKIAEFYEKEVDRVIAGLTSIIEPLLIVFLGGVVGLIVASVFGPISQLSNVVG